MNKTTLDCGCVYTPYLPKVMKVDRCLPHKAALALSLLHGSFPGHEDCCDVPDVKREMERHGWTVDDLLLGIPHVDAREREYAREVVNRIASDAP